MMPLENSTTISKASDTSDSNECSRSKPTVLVMGIGNILLSDEGAGIRVIENLLSHYTFPEAIEVIDGGTMGMELLSYFDEKSNIIIIDAVRAGFSPGTVTKIDNLPAFFKNRISPHQIGLTDVLAMATVSEGSAPNVLLFGIEPGNIDTGMDMSREVRSKINYLADKVVEELRSYGFKLEPK